MNTHRYHLTTRTACMDCGDLAPTSAWTEDNEILFLCDECHPTRSVHNSSRRDVHALRMWEVKAA